MCGIFGVCFSGDSASKEEWTVHEMATMMFPAIRHRGPHAFGWMAWDGSELDYARFQGDVALMSNLSKVKVPLDAKWMVCHVRYATHGLPSYEGNNHPILHGGVLGVHNGSIRNYLDVLDETGREDPKAEVDSEAIFAAVDQWGHQPGLRRLDGNMTTVYTKTSKPEELFFARSTKYELVMARTAAGSLVFASEFKVLAAAFGGELADRRMMGHNQLIKVVDGKVRQSHIYRRAAPEPPRLVYSTPTRAWDGHRWEGVLDLSAHRALDAARKAAGEAPRAARRPKKSKAPRPQGYRDGMEVRPGLFYYNGLLLTEDDYVEAIAKEVGFE